MIVIIAWLTIGVGILVVGRVSRREGCVVVVECGVCILIVGWMLMIGDAIGGGGRTNGSIVIGGCVWCKGIRRIVIIEDGVFIVSI